MDENIQIAIKIFWNALSFYCIIVSPYISLGSKNRAYYVHTLDRLAIIILRYVIICRIKNFLRAIGELVQLRKLIGDQIHYKNFKRFNFVFITMAIVHFLLLLVRLHCDDDFKINAKFYTFGIVTPDTSKEVQEITSLFLYFVIGSAYFLIAGLSATATLIAYYSLTEMHRILNMLNETISDFLENDITVGKLVKIYKSLCEVVSLIRKVNCILSPILFTWFVFWIVNSCYSLSTLLGPHGKSGISLAGGLLTTAILFLQFLLLVFRADFVDLEILKTKDIIFNKVAKDDGFFYDVYRATNFALIISFLKRCRKEIFVTPLGMFRLERRLILAILGIIISYEVIILQLIRD